MNYEGMPELVFLIYISIYLHQYIFINIFVVNGMNV